MPYRIDYSPESEQHMRSLTARQRAVVLDGVDQQLAQQPTVQTRNRKPMRPNPFGAWELRIANLRVYYTVQTAPEFIVLIRAVGVKIRNRVRIGKEIVQL